MRVRNRLQMASLLGERMNGTYSALSELQELKPNTSLVKTYMLEAHLAENASHSEVFGLVKSSFTKDTLGSEAAPRVIQCDDLSLTTLDLTLKGEQISIFIDAVNPRFWLVHSMSSSALLDLLVERLIARSQGIDRAWLPAGLLEKVARMGSFRGLGLDYDRRKIPDIDFEQEESVESLKMQLWGNKAWDILRILGGKDAFPHETTLAKVKVKFWLTTDRGEEFSLDDIKYDGKVTARGTSFESHISLVTDVYRAYREEVIRLEQEYAIKDREENGKLRLTGEPITFVFGRSIRDLSVFLRTSVFCDAPISALGCTGKTLRFLLSCQGGRLTCGVTHKL